MTSFEIPTSPQPQVFTISLAGVVYTLTLRWNVSAAVWMLDIADQNGNQIVAGTPLVTGADLLEQLGYLGLGFALYATTDHAPELPPTFANLGSAGHLYAVTP